jgi:hypothetical protein
MVRTLAGVLGSVGFIWFCIALDVLGLAGLVYQVAQLVSGRGSLFSVLLTVSLLVTQFAAQSVIQLIALPVLQNYQSGQSAADEAKKEADHRSLTHLAHVQDTLLTAVRASHQTMLEVLAERRTR